MFTRAPAPRPPRSPASSKKSVSVEKLEPRQLFAVGITIDAGSRAQTMDGFGTSFGGYTPNVLTNSTKFQKMYYQDLGASMVRVPLQFTALRADDGSLATPVYMGPDLKDNIKKFNFADPNTLRVGKMVRASVRYGVGKVAVIASLWTPPHWMKGAEVSSWDGKPNGKMPELKVGKNGGSSSSIGGSLIDSDENLTQFARYVSAFVKGYEAYYGVHIDAVNLQNEPAFRTWYSSAVYSPQLYVKAVKAVSRWFKKYGITTQLMGPEDVGVGNAASPSILQRQMRYIEAIRRDPEAVRAVDVLAIHGYAQDGRNANRSPQMWGEYYNGRKSGNGPSWTGVKADGKPLWMTEVSGEGPTWGSAIRVAQTMQDGITRANVGAWVFWGIANSTTQPHGEALTQGTDATAKKYSAFKHFSRYVRPGAVRLATNANDPFGVYASAFVHDKDKTLTTVLINGSDTDQKIRLRLPGIDLAKFDIGYVTDATHSWTRLRAFAVESGLAKFTLPANSVITLQGGMNRPKPASVSGFYYKDRDADKKFDGVEVGLPGDKIFVDANNNNRRDARELFATTDAKGYFRFDALAPGAVRLRREMPAGWEQTTPVANLVLTGGQAKTGVLIGARPRA
ncbi:MAG TPA: glycoside hydrolase family 30 beta sandwich domain-containing protein [Tepidisphaeraceae bacterium]|jgi:O-glycosyl hydrolase